VSASPDPAIRGAEHEPHQIPSSFNRHASAHAVSTAQYSPANAAIALTLATSMVREAHEEILLDLPIAEGTALQATSRPGTT
jgi:hypothetical protein